MAVSLKLRATTPPRGRGAFNPIPVSTPMGATGRVITSAKTAVYGTVEVGIYDPARHDSIESMTRANTNRTFFNPTWSVLVPTSVSGLPRLPHRLRPTTVAVGTSVGPPGGVAPQPRGRARRRTGAMHGRVTSTPKPTIAWRRQGRPGAPRGRSTIGKEGIGPIGSKMFRRGPVAAGVIPKSGSQTSVPASRVPDRKAGPVSRMKAGPNTLRNPVAAQPVYGGTTRIRASAAGPTGMPQVRRGTAHLQNQAPKRSPMPRAYRPQVRKS